MSLESSRHRSKNRPRKILAGWIIAAVVVVLVVIGTAVGWTFAHKSIDDNRTMDAVQDCSAGYLTIEIWAPAGVQDSLTELITSYQATLPSDGGLCASFSISAQPSSEAAAELMQRAPYVPGVWIGSLSDIKKVEKKHPSLVVTTPEKMKGTSFYSVSLDLAQNDPANLDETTAEHTTEATQAAVDVDTYLQQQELSFKESTTTTAPSAKNRSTSTNTPSEKTSAE